MEDFAKRLRRWGKDMRECASCPDDTLHADAVFVESVADELDRLKQFCRDNGVSDTVIRRLQ